MIIAKRVIAPLAVFMACFVSVGVSPVLAASMSTQLFISVRLLTQSSGTCTSKTFNAQTNAIVQVVCGTNEFVSIEPNPAKRFLGVHGIAHRYILGQKTGFDRSIDQQTDSSGTFGSGSGNVTSLRVLGDVGADGTMEMLVTF